MRVGPTRPDRVPLDDLVNTVELTFGLLRGAGMQHTDVQANLAGVL